MPKDQSHRRQKDKDCKQINEFDFDFDCDKKNSDRKTKYALKETLKVLNDFVESQKKTSPCQTKKNKCCDKKNKKPSDCCCDNDCAKCVVASRDSCDAPVIDKLINTVYTNIPIFPLPLTGALIPLTGTTSTAPYSFPDFNYYVSLPCDDQCGEIRLLWPFVWMVQQIIQKLTRFTGTGFVRVRLNLNVLSKKIIKDPAQLIPTLNTGGLNNGPCLCDSAPAVQYDYTFLLAFAESPTIGAPSVLTTGSTVTFSSPNNPRAEVFAIDPTTLGLSHVVNSTASIAPLLFTFLSSMVLILPSDILANLLIGLGVPPTDPGVIYLEGLSPGTIVPGITVALDQTGALTLTVPVPGAPSFVITVPTSLTVTSSIPSSSPAHYVSFVPSCDKEGCDSYYIATNLETLRV